MIELLIGFIFYKYEAPWFFWILYTLLLVFSLTDSEKTFINGITV